MNRSLRCIIPLFVGCALVVGCESMTSSKESSKKMDTGKTAVAHLTPSKSATTMPANTNVTGTVKFTDEGNGKTKIFYNFGRYFEYLPLDLAQQGARVPTFLGMDLLDTSTRSTA